MPRVSRLSTEKLQSGAAEIDYLLASGAAVQISADKIAVTATGDARSLAQFSTPRAVKVGGDGTTTAGHDLANASIPSEAAIPLPTAGRPAFAIPEVCPPTEIAARVCQWSLAKTSLSLDRLIVLGFLAGVYMALAPRSTSWC